MKEVLAHYWYLGLAIGALTTLWSIVDAFRIRARFRALERDVKNQHGALLTQGLAVHYVQRDVAELEHYLEKTPTSYIPIPLIRVRGAH